METLLTVVATAVATAVLTVLLLALGARWLLAVRLRSAVRRELAEVLDEELPRVRYEVEAGVAAGAERALPELRRSIRDGFRDALDESVSPREIARRGASFLDAFLGRREDPDSGR